MVVGDDDMDFLAGKNFHKLCDLNFWKFPIFLVKKLIKFTIEILTPPRSQHRNITQNAYRK
jgi:hypothetical protein